MKKITGEKDRRRKGQEVLYFMGGPKSSELLFPRCRVVNLLPWFLKEIRTIPLKLLVFRGNQETLLVKVHLWPDWRGKRHFSHTAVCRNPRDKCLSGQETKGGNKLRNQWEKGQE